MQIASSRVPRDPFGMNRLRLSTHIHHVFVRGECAQFECVRTHNMTDIVISDGLHGVFARFSSRHGDQSPFKRSNIDLPRGDVLLTV